MAQRALEVWKRQCSCHKVKPVASAIPVAEQPNQTVPPAEDALGYSSKTSVALGYSSKTSEDSSSSYGEKTTGTANLIN